MFHPDVGIKTFGGAVKNPASYFGGPGFKGFRGFPQSL
jgi:hypothetical protein